MKTGWGFFCEVIHCSYMFLHHHHLPISIRRCHLCLCWWWITAKWSCRKQLRVFELIVWLLSTKTTPGIHRLSCVVCFENCFRLYVFMRVYSGSLWGKISVWNQAFVLLFSFLTSNSFRLWSFPCNVPAHNVPQASNFHCEHSFLLKKQFSDSISASLICLL